MRKVLILTFLIPSIGFCQTGPGGVGSDDGTSNLEYWIDANRGVTGSSPITIWSDLSGNATTNSIIGNPSLTSSSLNGYDVVTFDGTDYISTNMNISGGVYPQLDIYTVYNFVGPSGAIWGEDNGGYDRFLVRTTTPSNCFYGLSHGTGCTDDAALFPSSTPVITSVQFSEDVTNGSSAIINGATRFSFTSNHENETSNNFDVASIGTGSFRLPGDIAELFVFSRSLNQAEQIILFNYLSAKYDITLTSNDVYNEDDASRGDYDHDVAGIGRVDASNLISDAQGTGIVRILNPTGLGNNEFLMWGHDGGIQEATNTTDVPTDVQARFDRVWRVSEVNITNNGRNVGNIDMRWDLTGMGAINPFDLRLLIDTDRDGNFNDETAISGATSLGGDIYAFTGVSDIRNNVRFTLGTRSMSQTPLPIELLNFNAETTKFQQVRLDWQTATEANNDYFTIERSDNGIDWDMVSMVDGAGNSSHVLSYTTVDEKPYQGVSYYRLKQTDFDGKYTYSPIRAVNLQTESSEPFLLYPNPTTGTVKLVGRPSVPLSSIGVYTAIGREVTGKVVLTQEASGIIDIDLAGLAAGTYVIKSDQGIARVNKRD